MRKHHLENVIYTGIIHECERMEREGIYSGNGHHLAQRLVKLALEEAERAPLIAKELED